MAKDLKHKLFLYQRRAVWRALKKEVFAFFMAQGTGKTITVLATCLRKLKGRPKPWKILIICPKAVVGVWRVQVAKHVLLNHQIIRLDIAKISRQIADEGDSVDFYVMTYGRVFRHWKKLLKVDWDCIIADESHRIKRPTSQQSRGMSNLAQAAPHRYLLTGTPRPRPGVELDNEADLAYFGQFRFLEPSLWGENWWQFQKRYTYGSGYGGFKPKILPRHHRALMNRLKPYVYRIRKEDALDLPPVTHIEVPVELTGQAKRHYQQIENDFVVEYGGITRLIPGALPKINKLQQLTGGYLSLGKKGLIELEQDKLSLMVDLISDFERDKLVIAARFLVEMENIDRVMRKMGRTTTLIHGGMKEREIEKAWVTFQSNPRPEVAIVQVNTGGVGIELFAACVCIIYSNTYSWTDFDQFISRIDRKGQERKVSIYHLLVQNSIDRDIFNSLYLHQDSAIAVVNILTNRRRKEMAAKKVAKKKVAKKKVAKKTARKSNLPEFVKPDWGVPELAEHLGIETASVRVKLRNAEIPKEGRTYDFGSKKGMEKVAKQLQGAGE